MENGLSTIESFVILIAIAVVVMLALYYLDSKKKTKREKIADAVDKFSDSTTVFFSNTAHKIFDSKETKEKTNAANQLVFAIDKFRRHAWFYDYGKKNKIGEAYEYESHKQSLEILNISKTEWIKFGGMCYYAGIIEDYNHSEWNGKRDKLNKDSRKFVLQPSNNQELFINRKNNLLEALEYFCIPEDEWLEYGDVVLDMHGIRDQIQAWYDDVLKRNGLKD